MTLEVHLLSIPNPFFEGRNSVYVVKSDPVTLVDSGVATDKAFAALQQGLTDLRLTVRDIRRVILTHKHIDHIGNAWRVQQAGGAQLLIHRSETKSVTDVDPNGNRFRELVDQKLVEWQVPVEQHPQQESGMPIWQLQDAEAQAVDDADVIEFEDGQLEVIHTPGHTQGSICLRSQDQLFSGDHVLQDISPNVGGGDLRCRGLLGRFLASLSRITSIDDGVTVFPGHGGPFHSVRRRCQQLQAHHDQRLKTILAELRARPQTVFELATSLFGQLEGIHLVLGCAEANAHLELLAERNEVAVDHDQWQCAS